MEHIGIADADPEQPVAGAYLSCHRPLDRGFERGAHVFGRNPITLGSDPVDDDLLLGIAQYDSAEHIDQPLHAGESRRDLRSRRFEHRLIGAEDLDLDRLGHS